ncbi:MAG TPA: hypothetical protein VFL86_16640, partial [Burkholderiaceae bacterium]|nr:hypothetical protein [Burkholderiaceae bacterium]
DDHNGNNGARQFVKKSSAKLTMTLVFDTTQTGASVRDVTANIAALLEPAPDGTKKFAPKVEFGWGTYSFKGVVEQFKETIDFFSASGVPLRSSINLTLASQNVEFQSNKSPSPTVDRSPRPDPVAAPPGTAPTDAANALGDPRAARDIASANGSDSLRFGGSASLSVGGSISLSAAASFSVGASAGLSVGGGIGAGIGGGIGVGVSGGAGLSLGGGASAGAGLSIGGSAGLSASGLALSATAGPAFVGLRVSPPSATVSIADARATLLPAPSVSGAASFNAGGRAQASAGGSLSANVGANADLSARIGFGD